ncbi:zinc finger protein 836 [Rhipicephalus sanguineus]|uniref:zinc finger protein 836 n=1 Tax=Rhipicephalus sanguineus TaxID=34632 RepID=UPI0020C2D9A0|nr:zinc finger protein 836 [Rhipicephalus sanguineus]
MPVIVSSQSLSQENFDNVSDRPSSVTVSNLSAEVAVNSSSCDEATSKTTDDVSGMVTYASAKSIMGPSTLSCQYCPFVAKHRSVLALHLRIHSNERPYKCDVCGLTFKRKDHIKYHRRIHTGMPFIVSCQSLSKEIVGDLPSSPSSAAVSSFPARVDEAKASSCEEATSDTTDDISGAVTYASAEFLTVANTLRCQYCPYVAKYPSALAVHLQTHSNERPYKCDVCGQAFKLKKYVENHKRIHTEQVSMGIFWKIGSLYFTVTSFYIIDTSTQGA